MAFSLVNIVFQKIYLKNLPRDVTKEELASLFVRFESMDTLCIEEYRILDDRIQGQAFISFQGTCFNYLIFITNRLL